MLESLHVKNLALIENCEIEFSNGLNILTGETGAGKSILLGSVNLALGARADAGIIRTGAEEGSVELVFSNSETTREYLKSADLPYDEDIIVISRKITPSKSIFKINGDTVLAKQVKELAGILIDIHGQHEHQSLLSTQRQRDMIDAYYGDSIYPLLDEVSKACKKLSELKEELERAKEKTEGRDREISLLEYEVNEIEEAGLVIGEDETLESDYRRMLSAEKLSESAGEALELVSSENGENAGEMISRAISLMNRVVSLDDNAGSLLEKLKEAEGLLGDFSLELSRYVDKLEFDPEDLSKTEERLDVLNGLKNRFGNTIEDVLKSLENKKDELSKLKNYEEYVAGLENELNKAKKDYELSAQKLTDLRKKSASEFEKQLKEILLQLNFLNAEFYVKFDTDYNKPTAKGSDDLEFMISTNPGEPVKPVKDVASGGELSRIMLGIKTILANKDDIDSLIFDEIDSGISGVTAKEVGKMLTKLSKKHQVICITHLAQIAALADRHFGIEKKVTEGKTVTEISTLSKDEEIKELTRLLGGDTDSRAALSNALELKAASGEYKAKL